MATRDNVEVFVLRLLAHFPRRDTSADAVIVLDLTRDLTEAKVSAVALASVCDELRRESSFENPFMPPSGEILKRCIDRTRSYEWIHGKWLALSPA